MSGTPEQPMSYRRALLAFGNGDLGRGQQNLFMLARRLEEERRKFPVFALGSYNALEIIGAEYRELARAVALESSDSQCDKALAGACAMMRFINREHVRPVKRGKDAQRAKR